MAFSALFYTFSKRVNSTKIPSSGATSTLIELKEESDIINPTIVLSGIPNPYVFNFCYISEFDRYYWVDNWRWIHGRWLATLHVDVLASYKAAIGASSQYVLRSASESDGAVKDTLYPIIESLDITTQTLEITRPVSNKQTDGAYIVGIISEAGAYGAVAYYIIQANDFQTFKQALFGSLSYITQTDVSNDLVKTYFNPYDYITTCKFFPITNFSSQIWTLSVTSIDIGYWSITCPAKRILVTAEGFLRWSNTIAASTVPKHPQAATRGVYLNGEDYTEYSLILPPFGVITLPNSIALTGFTILEGVDLITGEGRVTIMSSSGTTPLKTVVCQFAVDQQLAQVRMTGGFIGQVATDTATTLARIGNAFKDVIGAGNNKTLQSVASTTLANYSEVSTSGTNGGYLNLGMYGTAVVNKALLTKTSKRVADEDNTHLGRPLCKTRTISTLSGFTMCEDPDISINGTAGEAAQIVAFMASGFYYE